MATSYRFFIHKHDNTIRLVVLEKERVLVCGEWEDAQSVVEIFEGDDVQELREISKSWVKRWRPFLATQGAAMENTFDQALAECDLCLGKVVTFQGGQLIS